jgi:hypothetical protein
LTIPGSGQARGMAADQKNEKIGLDRDDQDHDFIDQSQVDFDPDDGLYSGTAVDGTSEIAGPHIDAETGELSGLDEAKSEEHS